MVSLRRKFCWVVPKSLKTLYFNISYYEKSKLHYSQIMLREEFLRKERKILWNFAGTSNSCLGGVQTVSVGEVEIPCSLCFWDLRVRDRNGPMVCFSLKSSLSTAQNVSILIYPTWHHVIEYIFVRVVIELDSAYVRLTWEMQRKLYDSAQLSFNFHSSSSITLLEMCSSSLVISSKNLSWSFPLKILYESCKYSTNTHC